MSKAGANIGAAMSKAGAHKRAAVVVRAALENTCLMLALYCGGLAS